jgi:predicted acyl esterase
MIAEKERDGAMPMRDGVNLSIDIYRRDSVEKFPRQVAFSI